MNIATLLLHTTDHIAFAQTTLRSIIYDGVYFINLIGILLTTLILTVFFYKIMVFVRRKNEGKAVGYGALWSLSLILAVLFSLVGIIYLVDNILESLIIGR